MKVREPVARPLDVVSAELILSASQAFLVGVLMYLSIGIWEDRAVGFGSVAIVLGLLGLAIGGAWLYWLLGGMGWPLAAANVPTAMFLGFALVLGWRGDDLVRVEGVPLLLSLAASIYGVVCGVFLDSPRRWRWDQRQKPRPGTAVPRVSATTRSLMAQVPRSVPRRSTAVPQAAEHVPSRTGQPTPPGTDTGSPYLPPGTDAASSAPETLAGGVRNASSEDDEGLDAAGADRSAQPAVAEELGAAPVDPAAAAMPTERLGRVARAESPVEDAAATEEPTTIELPTSIEPKAQRSPWAWAAPPEWTRDEDDEAPRGRTSGRS